MPKLIVQRNSEWNNRECKIGIYVDDQKLGTQSNGETHEFEVENGKHEIYAKIDWCKSQNIEANIRANETKTLKLSGFKYGSWIYPSLLGIMLVYYILNYAFNLDFTFMIWFAAVVMLYPIYCITFGKNSYLLLSEKFK